MRIDITCPLWDCKFLSSMILSHGCGTIKIAGIIGVLRWLVERYERCRREGTFTFFKGKLLILWKFLVVLLFLDNYKSVHANKVPKLKVPQRIANVIDQQAETIISISAGCFQ